MGCLYLVSTPIGNRQDISMRALAIFKELDYLLCEDTRKTKQLLEFYQIVPLPQLISFYEPVETQKTPLVIDLLKQGKKVGLVSNAGTPLISDPGFKLVRECRRQNLTVTALPGASAVLTALTISGLATDKFTFLGFLPKKDSKKTELLNSSPYTLVAYESPYRLLKTLNLIAKILPQAQVVIARELTKKFEETFHGTATEILNQLEGKSVKGETVICLQKTP